MTMPKFPCIAWRSESPINSKQLVANFLDNRFDERWMLVADHAVLSQQQLWTAWNCCERNFANGNQLARGRDAEFLRYIAGTHHISDAFVRAGVQDGATSGWILYLPIPILAEVNDGAKQISGIDEENLNDFSSKGQKLLNSLGLESSSKEPIFSSNSAQLLGLNIDGIVQDRLEQALIGHILAADFSA